MPFVNDGFAKQDPSGDLTASDIPSGIDAAKIHDGSVSNTEFGYLDGVAGPLNPQLIPYAGDAGGSANALTATVAGHTETAGAAFRFRATLANTGAVTIAVNGGSARLIRKRSQSSVVASLEANDLQAGGFYTAIWDTANSMYQLAESRRLAAADIPSTLNATTFNGDVTLASGTPRLIKNTSAANSTAFCGGQDQTQASGASIIPYGNSHATKPGDAEYYTGTASGAAHSFFDKNGAEQLKIDENGIGSTSITLTAATALVLTNAGGILSGASGNALLHLNSNVGCSLNYSNGIGFLSDSEGGSIGSTAERQAIKLYKASNATYPGAHQQFAPLSTRAASTAFAVCPVATGDTAKVEVSETTIDDCLAFVNAAGSVALYDKIGGTVNANIVNSSSPAAGEYGVYISAGVLYFKGGSSYAGKMGSFSKVWKA